MWNNKKRVLEYINAHNCYNRPAKIAEGLGVSKSTVYKWLRILVQEKQIKRVNLGIYSANYVYISLETLEEIRRIKY